MNRRALRYVLWDHDGVLVDTEPLYHRSTVGVLGELGVDVDLSTYLRFMAAGAPLWRLALERGVTDAQVAEGKERRNVEYQRLIRSEGVDIPGVEPVLATLAQRYGMAIVTTAKRTDFELIHGTGAAGVPPVVRQNIVGHMQFVLANGDYARSKPEPDPYLTALERMGGVPEEAIVVEDSERGLASAVAAGIDCVVVDHPFTRGQDLSAATHRIESLAALPALLASEYP